MVDILGDLRQELRDLMRRIRVLESASPLGYSSISEGALEIRSEEGLIVQGSARVDGVLKGSGTFDWTGPMNLQGAQTVTGDVTYTGQLTVNGPWDMNGNGSIAGAVDLTGDMAVKSGGSITVQGSGGDVVLSSTYSAPRVNLGGAQIDGGTSFTFTAGSTTVYFTGGTIRIAGMPTRSAAQYPGSFPNAVVADASGNLYRIV